MNENDPQMVWLLVFYIIMFVGIIVTALIEKPREDDDQNTGPTSSPDSDG